MGDLKKNPKVLTPYTEKELVDDDLYPSDSAQLRGRKELVSDSPTDSDKAPAKKTKKAAKEESQDDGSSEIDDSKNVQAELD